MKELHILIAHNEATSDWSVTLNGLLHEHVSSRTLEDLVEHAVLLIERSLLEPTLTSGGDILPSNAQQHATQSQIDLRIQRILESNDELATALGRLRESHAALMAGKPVKNVDEIWAQSEAALRRAGIAKSAG